MTDIFLEDRPSNKQGCLRAILVAAAIVLVGWLLIKGCGNKETTVPDDGEPVPASEATSETGKTGKSGKAKAGDQTAQAPTGPDLSAPLLAEAKRFYEQKDLQSARGKAFDALERATSDAGRKQVEAFLGQLHIEMLLNPVPMAEKTDYTIKKGDIIGKIARTHKTTPELVSKSNNIRDERRIRINDRFRVFSGTFKIVVSKSDNTLLVLLNDRFFKRYMVGTGEFDKTPEGTFKVKDRIVEPDWWQPNGQKIAYGDPEHLIGTRWLGLTAKGYGIHGIREDLHDTIGKSMSAGCIRMLNSEVEELHIYIPNGTEVTIQQ